MHLAARMSQATPLHPQPSSIDDLIDAMILRQRPPQIILAEDDPEMRSLVAAEIREEGYDVIEVRDGIELVRTINRFEASLLPLGLIISDVRMPGFTGLETLEYLRYAGLRVPVILMTAFGDRRTHAEARDLGARLVLDKPFDFGQMRAAVGEILPRAA